jgi:drug/metabolite transporter (DMT)-like permease
MISRLPRSSVWFAEAAVVLMALIWGVNYSVIKYGTSIVQATAYNAVRVALGTVVLLIVARLIGGAPPARRDMLALMALGALGNGVYQIFFAEGITRTRAGEAALIAGASPALIATFSRLAGIERPNRKVLGGILLSIFGVALIVLTTAAAPVAAPGSSLFGDLLVLVGSICWAVYTVLLIPYTKRNGGFWIIAMTMAGGTIVLLLAGGRAIMAMSWTTLPASLWYALVYSGIGGLVVAYFCWLKGVKVLGPTRTSLFTNLQLPTALIVAWLTLHETPTIWQVVGAITILSGALLTRAPSAES